MGIEGISRTALQYLSIPSVQLLLVGCLMFLYLIYSFSSRDGGKYYPPGPQSLPLLGSLLSLIVTTRQQHEVIYDWTDKYGPIFSFRLLNKQFFVLSDIKTVQESYHDPALSDRILFAVNKPLVGRQNCGTYKPFFFLSNFNRFIKCK